MHGNMPITPADLGIPQSEVDRSQEWWRAMSLNEWKQLEAKHNVLSFLRGRWKTIHEIWTKEGKPCSTQP
jgi:hypothetical protein